MQPITLPSPLTTQNLSVIQAEMMSKTIKLNNVLKIYISHKFLFLSIPHPSLHLNTKLCPLTIYLVIDCLYRQLSIHYPSNKTRKDEGSRWHGAEAGH